MILVGTDGKWVIVRVEEDGKEEPLRFTVRLPSFVAVQLSQQIKLSATHAQEFTDNTEPLRNIPAENEPPQ